MDAVGAVAQLGERHTGSVEVRGSSPLGSTIANRKGGLHNPPFLIPTQPHSQPTRRTPQGVRRCSAARPFIYNAPNTAQGDEPEQ